MNDHQDPPHEQHHDSGFEQALGPTADSAPDHGQDQGHDQSGGSLASAPAEAPPAAGETRLQAGLHFIGNAVLAGPCTVSGDIEGHLRTGAGASAAVVVTASGRVRGDISARRIDVFGSTEGVLDADTGDVALHDGARVKGVVRYGRIRVDGADLNATLERVNPNAS